MRKYYRSLRNRVLALMENCSLAGRLTITEENAGLHFLVKVDTREPEAVLIARCEALGLHIRSLGSYYHGPVPENAGRTLVGNYSGLTEAELAKLAELLENL